MDVLEEELKEAKIAVNQLGGSIPADTMPERNAVLSEAQVLHYCMYEAWHTSVTKSLNIICNAQCFT